MTYLANPTNCKHPLTKDATRRAMSEGRLGCITTPKQGNRIPEGAPWCADNGKFGKGWPGAVGWFSWLTKKVDDYGTERCLFATAPDVINKQPDGSVIGDPRLTLIESRPWLPKIRSLGIPAAFVAQDECVSRGLIPWGEFDVLFLGGSNEFKLGPEGAAAVGMALDRGLRVHAGRVNSCKRMKYVLELGCSTSDGTFLTRHPHNLIRVIDGWFKPLGLTNFDGFDPYDRTVS
jgi:hypothetical protein